MIRARQAEIARLEVLDNGNPFSEADWMSPRRRAASIYMRGSPNGVAPARARGRFRG
jgi:hypothetical protein